MIIGLGDARADAIAAYRVKQAALAAKAKPVDRSSADYQAAVERNKIAIAFNQQMRKYQDPRFVKGQAYYQQGTATAPQFTAGPAAPSNVAPSSSALTNDPDAPMPPGSAGAAPEPETLMEKFSALSMLTKAAIIGAVGLVGYKLFVKRGGGIGHLLKS